MITFLKAGGTGGTAAEYLEAEKDHLGRDRAGVQVLRGDPELVARIADSLEFKNKYTSGVIAWAKEDNPTPEEIDKTLDSFEAFAWAGLEKDRYTWSAIRHDEPDGKVHVHIFAARVDLETGKSLNIAPPYWQSHFIPWCNTLNNERGWARPDDPERKKDVSLPNHEEKLNAARRKLNLGDKDSARVELTKILELDVMAGSINNREDVKAALLEYGEITREGEKYISIKPPGEPRAIRLRGPIYDEQFNGELYREAKGGTARKRAGDQPGNDERVKPTRTGVDGGDSPDKEKYLECLEKRRAYHRKKYRAVEDGREDIDLRSRVLSSPAVPAGVTGNVRDGAVHRTEHHRQDSSADGIRERTGKDSGPRAENRDRRRAPAGESADEEQPATHRMAPRRKRPVDHRYQEEITHDGIRDQVVQHRENHQRQSRDFGAGIERYRRANRNLKQHNRNLAEEPGLFERLAKGIQETIERIRIQNIAFKQYLTRAFEIITKHRKAREMAKTPKTTQKTAYRADSSENDQI